MIDAHRGAFEYDWRTRFHLPITVVGKSMSWGEALRLTEQLAVDPSARIGAALAGWANPVSREAMVLMDLYDLQHMSKASRKPKPYPRPWQGRKTQRAKPDDSLTQEEIIAALRAAGHTAPLPTRDRR